MKSILIIIVAISAICTFLGCNSHKQKAEENYNQKQKVEKNHSEQKWEKLVEGSHSHTVGYSHIVFFDSNNGLGLRTLSLEKTDDGGKTWQSAFNGDLAAYSLVFTNKENGWMVGMEDKPYKFKNDDDFLENNSKKYKPLVLKTEDGGANWQKIIVDEQSLTQDEKRFSLFYDTCFDKNSKNWIVGDAGIVEASIDGQRLNVLNLFHTEDVLYSVFCAESGEVWAVGQGESVLQYQNGWSKKAVGNEIFLKKDAGYIASFNKVKVVDNDVWLVGSYRQKLVKDNEELDLRGVLFRSRDKGQSWENKTPDSAEALYDIHFDAKNGWLVGGSGSIYNTKDGGDSWIKQESPTNSTLSNIFFLDSANGWISGDKATILRFAH